MTGVTVEVKVQTEQTVLTSSSCGVEVPVHPVVEGEERRGCSHLCTHVADGGHAWGGGRRGRGDEGREGKERKRGREEERKRRGEERRKERGGKEEEEREQKRKKIFK